MALSAKAELVLSHHLGNLDTSGEVVTAINNSAKTNTANTFSGNITFSGNVGFYSKAPVAQGAALTTALTTITITDAAGTPDYALSALTTTSPYGLATQAEAISLLYVIQNLQNRVNDIETRLSAFGFIP